VNDLRICSGLYCHMSANHTHILVSVLCLGRTNTCSCGEATQLERGHKRAENLSLKMFTKSLFHSVARIILLSLSGAFHSGFCVHKHTIEFVQPASRSQKLLLDDRTVSLSLTIDCKKNLAVVGDAWSLNKALFCITCAKLCTDGRSQCHMQRRCTALDSLFDTWHLPTSFYHARTIINVNKSA